MTIFPHGFCQDLIIQKLIMMIKMKYVYISKDPSQPPPSWMPSKRLILYGEAKSIASLYYSQHALLAPLSQDILRFFGNSQVKIPFMTENE